MSFKMKDLRAAMKVKCEQAHASPDRGGFPAAGDFDAVRAPVEQDAAGWPQKTVTAS